MTNLNEIRGSTSIVPATSQGQLVRAIGPTGRAILPGTADFQTVRTGAALTAELMLITGNKELVVLKSMTKEQRNEAVRNNPSAILAACQTVTQKELAKQRGLCIEGNNTFVSWKPSFVPFHLQFIIIHKDGECEHLASTRNKALKNPVSRKGLAHCRVLI